MAGEKGGKGLGSGNVTKNWEKSYVRSKTKVRQAKCRFCLKNVTVQNYSRHLKLNHKAEWEADPGNLRESGERVLSFFNRQSDVGPGGAAGFDPAAGSSQSRDQSRSSDRSRSPLGLTDDEDEDNR